MKKYYAPTFREYLAIWESQKINEEEGTDSGASQKEITSCLRIAMTFDNTFYESLSDEKKSELPKTVTVKLGGEPGEEGSLESSVQKWIDGNTTSLDMESGGQFDKPQEVKYYGLPEGTELKIRIESEGKKFNAIPLEIGGKKIFSEEKASSEMLNAYVLGWINDTNRLYGFSSMIKTKTTKEKVLELLINPTEGSHWAVSDGGKVSVYYEFDKNGNYLFGIKGQEEGLKDGSKWSLDGGEDEGGRYTPVILIIASGRSSASRFFYNPISKKFIYMGELDGYVDYQRGGVFKQNRVASRITYGSEEYKNNLDLIPDSETGYKKREYITLSSLSSFIKLDPRDNDYEGIIKSLPLVGKSNTSKGPSYIISLLKTKNFPVSEVSKIIRGIYEQYDENEELRNACSPFIEEYKEKIFPLIGFDGEKVIPATEDEEDSSSDAVVENLNNLFSLVFKGDYGMDYHNDQRFENFSKEFLPYTDRKIKSIYDGNKKGEAPQSIYTKDESEWARIIFDPPTDKVNSGKFRGIHLMFNKPPYNKKHQFHDEWPYSIHGNWETKGQEVTITGEKYEINDKRFAEKSEEKLTPEYADMLGKFTATGKISNDLKKITFPDYSGTNLGGDYVWSSIWAE